MFPAALHPKLVAFGLGVVIAPGSALRACARGRRSSNPYGCYFGQRLLAFSVARVRAEPGLDEPEPVRITTGDVLRFVPLAPLALLLTMVLAPRR